MVYMQLLFFQYLLYKRRSDQQEERWLTMDVIEPRSTSGNQNLFSGETLKDGINIYFSVFINQLLHNVQF